MRNWLLIVLALLVVSMLPSPGTEMGALRPASVLQVETEGKQIRLSTDTMDTGVGETLDGALRNLEQTTSGHVFLDTVENLVITEQTRFLLPELKSILRPAVSVCIAESKLNLETASEFLQNHVPDRKLRDTEQTTPLQTLVYSEERYLLGK